MLSGKGDLADIAGQPPLKMRHRRIFFTLRPQTPKEKSLVLPCSQIPFPVGGLLLEARGKNTGASVRSVVPLAPLAADVCLTEDWSLAFPLGEGGSPKG